VEIEFKETRDKMMDFFLSRDKESLQELENELRLKRMEEDKDFTKFLSEQHQYDMNYQEINTPLWKSYKERLRRYQYTSSLLSLCSFYKRNI